jgi:hypothetical protein
MMAELMAVGSILGHVRMDYAGCAVLRTAGSVVDSLGAAEFVSLCTGAQLRAIGRGWDHEDEASSMLDATV